MMSYQSCVLCRSRGFTILEVLITLFVVSIGLLGLSGLLNSALRYDREAQDTFMAAVLAEDIAGRMIINASAALNGDYDQNGNSAPSSCTSSTGCTSSQLADYDSATWKALVADTLPNGVGEVCIDSDVALPDCDGVTVGGRTLYVVSVTWWSREESAARTFRLEVHP